MLTQKRRGPAPTGKGTIVGVRLHDDILAPLDAFAAEQSDETGRPEAIRRILRDGLERLGYLKS